MISYAGIDEAVLVHALYHGTRAFGFGVNLDKDRLTVDQVRQDLKIILEQNKGILEFDYYRGRPLKFCLDMKLKQFDPKWYNRDSGYEHAETIILDLLTRA